MYQTLLLAVDLMPQSHSLLTQAHQLASRLGAKLHVIYIEPGVGEHSIEEIEIGLDAVHHHTMQVKAQQLQTLCQAFHIPLSQQKISKGDVVSHVIQHANAIHADLIITGEHSGFWHLQHTNEAICKQSKIDVLTFANTEH